LIKKYAERSDFGVIGAVGETPGFSRLMLKELAKVRDKTLKGTKTQEALDEANKFYRGQYGQFLRTDVKPMIKPDFGSGNGGVVAETYTVMGGEDVMGHIFKNGTHVEETLKAFPEVAPAGVLSRSEVKSALRTAYMQKLGLNGTVKLGKGMRM
ncbi:MAG TPA: hypothetical protein DEB18_15890, partial [Leeuwenhoekiella sp.]|nr:hypothetical protein [Leeuwenhoekiella sp.]